MSLTVVSAFYDIYHSYDIIETYFEYANFWSQLNHNVIIFTQSKFIERIIKLRCHYINKTHIICQDMTETYFYATRDMLIHNMERFEILNLNPEKDTPDYILLNNNKFYWLKRAIDLNPFKSDYFMWLDFGISHVADIDLSFYDWKIPDKIRQMRISIIPTTNYIEYFKYIRHNTSGGLISGHKKYMTQYIDLFYKLWETILRDGWYQLDEALMAIIQDNNRHLFDLYYGNYKSTLANYRKCTIFDDCIEQFIKISLDKQRYDDAESVLTYLESNFQGTEWCYIFLSYAIIGQYYYNQNHNLSPRITRYMRHRLSLNDVSMSNFIYRQYHNLAFYENIKYLWFSVGRVICQNDIIAKLIPSSLNGENVLVITKHFNPINFGFLLFRLPRIGPDDIHILLDDWTAISLKNVSVSKMERGQMVGVDGYLLPCQVKTPDTKKNKSKKSSHSRVRI